MWLFLRQRFEVILESLAEEGVPCSCHQCKACWKKTLHALVCGVLSQEKLLQWFHLEKTPTSVQGPTTSLHPPQLLPAPTQSSGTASTHSSCRSLQSCPEWILCL